MLLLFVVCATEFQVFGQYYRELSTETQDALAEANSTAEEVS